MARAKANYCNNLTMKTKNLALFVLLVYVDF